MWQTIDTAPRDETEILAFVKLATGDFYRVMYWEPRGESIDSGLTCPGWSLAESGYVGEFEPTHWMPLPDPPVATSEDISPWPESFPPAPTDSPAHPEDE